MTTPSTDKPWTVGFPLYPGCTLVDFAGATQQFSASGAFTPIWLSHNLRPITTTEDVEVKPRYTFNKHPHIDMLFIPGGGGKVADAMQDKALIEWVKRTAKKAEWAGSVCSGAFIGATAGLFDGCQATTYWSMIDTLAWFPKIDVVKDGYPRWVIDYDNRRFSGGGVSSSLDLGLRLVQLLAGTQVAEQAQLDNQYAPHPPTSSGDPDEADPFILRRELAAQQEGFIEPLQAATRAVLGA